MRLILLGAPGAGKGTQARGICSAFGIPQISTGDMLRAAIANDSDLGKAAQRAMSAGELVSDDIIIGIVKTRIAEADCQRGFLFDGFPRTIRQAQALIDAGVELDYVIEMRVKDETIIRRITGRRVHPGSGRVYHVDFNPPCVPGVDDETGEPLVQRHDDEASTVRKRLEVYHAQTEPLVAFYCDQSEKHGKPVFLTIDGEQAVAQVEQSVLAALKPSL